MNDAEVNSLLDTSARGLYRLFRNCALAVLNSGSTLDDGKELLDVYVPEETYREYTDPLPSFNIAFDLSEDWVLRLAANKSMTRPDPLEMPAAEGVAFTHTYCQNPICTPSRASFLTGMYPSTVHACINGNDNAGHQRIDPRGRRVLKIRRERIAGLLHLMPDTK